MRMQYVGLGTKLKKDSYKGGEFIKLNDAEKFA